MTANLKIPIFASLFILILSGCPRNASCRDMNLERFIRTDRIVITDNHGKELRTIQDKATISEITNFAASYSTNWETSWAGTPVALVQANFYAEDKFIGDLGVGGNFLTAQGCGGFQSRAVSAEGRAIIMRLFAVVDPYLSK